MVIFKRYVTWLFLICAVTLYSSADKNFKKSNVQKIIKTDGKGYYAYLPAALIYGDLNFGHFEPIEVENYPDNIIYEYRYKLDKKRIYNKYYVGTSIMMSPFFMICHIYSHAFGLTTDGYADQYHIAIALAAIFYLGLSLVFLGKIFDHFKFDHWIKVVLILCMFFGTNWFYYVMNEPSMSHAYSAAAISGFFVLFLNYIKKSTNKRLFLLGALLGLIVLIRPINALCVFALPILFGSWKEFTAFLKHLFAKPVRILYPIITFLAVVSIQFIIYKIQTNEFFLYSYVGESLNVLKPNLSNFLISYKKGLFVYAPILFISLLGIFYLFKASAFRAVWWLLFTFGLIWVLSSWHQWWYGGGFGSRVMIEYLLMWAIPLGFLLKHAKPPVRWSAVVICLLLVLLSQHQTQQYMMGMIHWENMTKEAYWSVFLRPI